ncbi:hypothetical protein [Pseudomonas putida]|uniref:hypothetical protein n=1 Tax=Pseudomonas putida TaxID=303 RepID=UPI0009822B72|nr:hypothetical protein [Pseudomonas putida]OMQ39324.1 hypothetical protein BKX96_08955 [Pseudomonas putida]
MAIQLYSRSSSSGHDLLELRLSLEANRKDADGDLKRLADALKEAGAGSPLSGFVFQANTVGIDTRGTIGGSAIAARQVFAVEFDVPGVLLDTDSNGLHRLRPTSDLTKDLDALSKWAEAQAGAAAKEQAAQLLVVLNDARMTLERVLSRREVTIRAGAQGSTYFGCTGIAGAVKVEARVAIDLQALLNALESGAVTGREVFRADLAASINFVSSSGSSMLGAVEFSCVVTDVEDSKIEERIVLIPRIDLPSLKGFPRLGFDFPVMPFPTLSLHGFTLGNPFRLFDVGLPLPTFAGGGLPSIPLKVQWTKDPQFKITVVGGNLSIVTTQTGDARIDWIKSTSQVDVAKVKDLQLTVVGGHYELQGGITFEEVIITERLSRKTGLGVDTALPVTVDIDDYEVRITLPVNSRIDLATGAASGSLVGMIDFPRIFLRSKEDPRLVLAFAATYETTVMQGSITGRLTELKVIEPYPVALIAATAENVIAGVIRLVSLIELPGGPSTPTFPDLPTLPDLSRLIERIGELLAASLKWMARQAGEALGAVANVLVGLIEGALDLMGRVIDLIGKGAATMLSHVAIEVRLDAQSCALKQVLITPVENPQLPNQTEVKPLEFAGLELSLPAAWAPTLLLDFSGSFVAALLVSPKDHSNNSDNQMVISTDLWLKRQGAPVEAVRDTDTEGKRPDTRLIQLRGWKKQSSAIAVVVLQRGAVSFLKTLKTYTAASENLVVEGTPSTTVKIGQFTQTLEFSDLQANDFDGSVHCDVDPAKSRLLPFFGTPKNDGGGAGSASFLDKLSQYVELKSASDVQLSGATISLPLSALIHLDDFSTTLNMYLRLDLATLNARLDAGEKFEIKGKPIPGDIFGLTYVIRPKGVKTPDPSVEFPQFELDFSSGSPRMSLHKDAEVDLFYSRLGGGGRGLVFKVSEFAVGQGYFDIVADVDPQEPVTLPGVDMPFRFEAGRLVVKRGEIQAFSITGCGQLPPELVGEANCKVTLSLGREPGGGRLAVLACDAELDKTQSPIVCHATRFELTISKLGFALEDMRGEGGYQFYFQVTGTLVFAPGKDEFSDTFLKNLRGLKITLNKAPLARDISRLSRAIDFQIPIEPKVTFNLFDVFAFELRGIGYLGSSDAFDGDPALVICGQAKLTPNSDVVSAKIDLHSMYISTQVSGTSLPRVRFEGLSVSLALKTGSVEATAIVVDDHLPTLYSHGTQPPKMTARGFLASGRINLKSWAPMSASMGFLELTGPEGDKRHAFFLYGQLEKLSTEIPTPIKPIYLREMGFGIGYRYTLAGLRRADAVTTPKALIEVLDDVSRYQNDLAHFEAWEPEATGDRLTLALRGMLSIDSASEEGDVSEAEELLPNLLLMDVAAALRSDLTFLMTVRAWLCVNYADWSNTETRESIATHPMLRGYLYISAPRQEFLARLLSDPNGFIGDHPKLPEPLVKAFRAVTWSATLYVRPGLFHYELGWPYELKFAFNENGFGISCEGGMVMRVEDSSILYGIAFRAVGFAHIGGEAGGRSLGASAVANLDFSLDAKFIALIALKQPRDTLFYGSIAFTCTVSIEVRIWMEISLGFDDIRIEIGLSLSRTLSLALEVAVEASGIAARGAASTSFAAFGRTLTLAIGFSFGEGRLEEARQRVARYLALGLTAAVPDPEQGLAPPPAAPPTKNDGTLNSDAEKHAVLSDVANNPPSVQPNVLIPIGGDLVGQPQFWAMLFEVPAFPDTYVMQLIPRDHTDIGKELKLGFKASTFFAHPGPATEQTETVSYELTTNTPLCRLLNDGSQSSVSNDLTAFYNSPLATSEKGKTLKLHELLQQCFVPKAASYDAETGQLNHRDEDDNQPLQPPFELIHSKDAGAHASPQQAAETLRVASSDMMKLSLQRAEWRATEERRSSVIASVVASAEAIARKAKVDGKGGIIWPRSQPSTAQAQVDARDLGLTFVVTEAQIGQLFDPTPSANPPKSKFKIRAVGASNLLVETAEQWVYLFNPILRFFDRNKPRLVHPKAWAGTEGVGLDWDLEPGWGTSKGIWNDPEFHLKHYEIERIVQVGGSVVSEIAPVFVQTKASAPLMAQVENGAVTWQRVRPLAQFVDDFADLPNSMRPAFRQQNEHSTEGYEQIIAAFNGLVKGQDRALLVIYTIVPVDIAGKRGVGVTIEYPLTRPQPPETALGRVELVVNFERFPGLPGTTFPTLFLRIDDLLDREKDDKEQPQRLPARGTRYALKVRHERAVLLGEFGGDTLGQALQRPGPAEFARDDMDDQVFEFELSWPVSAGGSQKASKDYRWKHGLEFIPIGAPANTLSLSFIKKEDESGDPMEKLQAALGVHVERQIESPRPVRLALKRLQRQKSPDEPGPLSVEPCPSPWIAVDMALRIGTVQTDELGRPVGSPVQMPVEIFECPVIAGYLPMEFADLDARAGRLLVDYPASSSSLGQLLDTQPQALLRLRDGERRIATQLNWATFPQYSNLTRTQVNQSPDHIAGYDVFEIDLTSITNKSEQIDAARHVARARLLDPRIGKADPAGIDDFGAVEAFYPSEALRLGKPQGEGGAARRRAWYSPAESLLAWARPTLRRSVGLAMNEVDIAALFDKGQPWTIEVAWSAETEARFPKERGTSFPAPAICYDSKAIGWVQGPFIPEHVGLGCQMSWTVGAARRLIIGLVLARNTASDWSSEPWVDAYVKGSGGASFKGMSLTLTGKCGGGVTGQTSVVVDLDQKLHPLLADVIDALRWDWTVPDSPYRRYRPVLEAAPPTKVTGIAELIDERPIERDPYGWAVLRTLGLAQGLRLFDMTTAAYEQPCIALKLIDQACAMIRGRYAGLGCGVPFVDVFTRTDGLMTTTSFDGGTPVPDAGSLKRLLADKAVCLTQISLRPMPEAMVRGEVEEAWTATAVRYFALTGQVPYQELPIGPLQFRFTTADLSEDVLVDVIDLVGGTNGNKPIALAHSLDGPAAKAFGSGRNVATSLVIEVPAFLRDSQHNNCGSAAPVALLRVISTQNDGREQAGLLLPGQMFTLTEIRGPVVGLNNTWKVENRWGHIDDPFDQFPSLDSMAIATLIQGNEAIKANESVKRNFDDFVWYVKRVFGQSPTSLPTDAKLRPFLERWPGFIRRYLAYGLASNAPLSSLKNTPFALATIAHSEPLRLIPSTNGVMQLLFLHKDRFARRRRYAVRPVGRYDALVSAWDLATSGLDEVEAALARLPWASRHLLADSFREGIKPAAVSLPMIKVEEKDDPLSTCSIDVVMPRTEPLAVPVVLGAARLDVGRGADRRPGRLLEFLVSRHPDEIASEANLHIADALQFEHQAFGFWREFSQPQWAFAYKQINNGVVIDGLPAIGNRLAVDPGTLSFKGATLEEDAKPYDPGVRNAFAPASLPERIVDGWRGITALRTDSVPHFYRLHLAVFAAAGVVVSKPVAAVIPESGYELNWPWTGDPGRFGADDSTSNWTVVRDDFSRTATVGLHIPLVRNIDGMQGVDRERWLAGSNNIPEVFLLPDPQVIYELSTRIVPGLTASTTFTGELSPEIEFLAMPVPTDDSANIKPCYLDRVAGGRFKVQAQTYVSPRLQNTLVPWRLNPSLRGPLMLPAATPVLERDAALTTLLQGFGGFEASPSRWQTAHAPWPLSDLKITVQPPSSLAPPDWSKWATELSLVEQELAHYLPASPSGIAQQALAVIIQCIRDFLDIAALPDSDRVQAWIELAGSDPSTGNPAIKAMAWPAGVPIYNSSMEGGQTRISSVFQCSTPVKWMFPLDQATTFDARVATIRAFAGAQRRVLTTAPGAVFEGPEAQDFAKKFIAAAWDYDMYAIRAADSAPFGSLAPEGGFAPISRAIPSALQVAAKHLSRDLPSAPDDKTELSPKAIFEFVAAVTVTLLSDAADPGGTSSPGRNARFRDLLTTLRTCTPVMNSTGVQGDPGLGFFAALEALAAFEYLNVDGSKPVTIELRLPISALQDDHPVLLALLALAQRVVFAPPGQLILRRPPTQADMHHLVSAGAGAEPALRNFLAEVASDQLFGRSRRLFLKASKGLVDPVVTVVERAP